ncbi:MAG: hypothetical protein AB7F89_10090 [Pirellulaceae bacterium]
MLVGLLTGWYHTWGRHSLRRPRVLPSQRSPRMTGVGLGVLAAAIGLTSISGCHHFKAPTHSAEAYAAATLLPNPLPVAAMDHEYLWQQVVDTIDDYFKIATEVRMRTDGGIVTDGRIHTHPEVASSYLEPWRKDSTTRFERTHATLQSLRKYAAIRVAPAEQGFLIDVAVYKELEDVAQPEHSTVSSENIRYDGSLIRNSFNTSVGPRTIGWLPLGRDMFLEQRILAELSGRLAEVPAMSPLPEVGVP